MRQDTSTELSAEDNLRLNVLLASKPLAIRINESRMTVEGLTEKREARIMLNPVGRSEAYLRRVRESISGHVLGSPGGYPVYLKRWTRMGQMRDESLAQLLLLGEPEAVVAAVCAPGLSDELARRAWWVMEDAENARRMLGSAAVVHGEMGKILARYLVEHLPFETEPVTMIETVRLVLQPGLIDQVGREELWKRGDRKNALRVGFLIATPDDLPLLARPRDDALELGERLAGLADAGNTPAATLLQAMSATGQGFLAACADILDKPANQDVVNTMLDIIAVHFGALRPEGRAKHTLEELLAEAEEYLLATEVEACVSLAPEWAAELRALRVLSGLSYAVVRPVLAGSTAGGSLMRRKLAPVMGPLLGQLQVLQGTA